MKSTLIKFWKEWWGLIIVFAFLAAYASFIMWASEFDRQEKRKMNLVCNPYRVETYYTGIDKRTFVLCANKELRECTECYK